METLIQLDHQVFSWINHGLSSEFLDTILVPLRHKLFWIPVYIFLLVFIYRNFEKSRWLIFLSIIVCISVSDISSSRLIKKSVERVRPCNQEQLDVMSKVPCSYGYSFTSSHATNHFAISVLLFLLFGFWKYRFLFIVWAATIAFAQVYVGLHFPLDVIAGALVGSFIGWASFYFYDTVFNRFLKHNNSNGIQIT